MSSHYAPTSDSFSLYSQRTAGYAASTFTVPSDQTSDNLSAEAHATLPQQWFASAASSSPPEPDLLRLLLTLTRNNIPIASSSEIGVANASDSASNVAPEMGAGSFGTVQIATWTPRDKAIPAKTVAVKRYTLLQLYPSAAAGSDAADARARVMHDILFELEILARCKHDNVARLLGVSFDDDAPAQGGAAADFAAPALLLEPAIPDTPDLARYLRSPAGRFLRVDARAEVLRGVARGLTALHSLGVVHADLKPENVLMFPPRSPNTSAVAVPKLSDFGMSGLSTSRDAPRDGSPLWNAPECMPGAGRDVAVFATGATRDVYSFGLLVGYVMCGGSETLWQGNFAQIKMDTADRMGAYVIELLPREVQSSRLGGGVQEALRCCLRFDPRARWQDLKQADQMLSLESANPGEIQDGVRKRGWRRTILGQFHRGSKKNLDNSPHREDFLPFGRTRLGGTIIDHEIVTLLTSQRANHVFRDKDSLPSSLRTALANQLHRKVLTTPDLSCLPLAHKRAALVFLEPGQLSSLYAARPDFKSFALKLRDSVMANLRQVELASPTVQQFLDDMVSEQKNAMFVELNALDAILGRNVSEDCPAREPVLQLELVHTAACGGADTFRRIYTSGLPRGGNINAKAGPFDWTPLHSAALLGNADVVSLIIECGGHVNAVLGNEAAHTLTALHLAVVRDRVEIVKALLQQPDIDTWTRDYGRQGTTAIHNACTSSTPASLSILKLLLLHDASLVHAKDEQQRTPLHHAAFSGNLDAVKLLLRHDANINARDYGGSSPLHLGYSAANGMQGAHTLIPAKERAGEIQIACGLSLPPNAIAPDGPYAATISSTAQTINASTGSPAELLRLMLPAYQRIVHDECPAGHDAFILLRRSSSPGAADTVFAFLDEASTMRRRQALERGDDPLTAAGAPHDDELELLLRCVTRHPTREGELELNISRLVDLNERILKLSSAHREPGQLGETYIRYPEGREMVKLMLDKGADPAAVNGTGYSPEAYAYRPEDLLYTLYVPLGPEQGYVEIEPRSAFVIHQRPSAPSTLDREEVSPPLSHTLFLKPFQGNWSVWAWIHNVLPCPSDLILFATAQRFDSHLQRIPASASDKSAVDVSGQTIIVEVQMHPPNDAHNTTKTLLRREWRLGELLPGAGEPFLLRLGDVPLRHKSTLLINIRSNNPPGLITAPIALTSITLRARYSFNHAAPLSSTREGHNTLPLTASARHPALNVPAEALSLPKFKPNMHWRPDPGKPSRSRKYLPSAIRTPNDAASRVAREATASLSLSQPNALLYTRPLLSDPSAPGDATYGEKTWHYPLGPGHEDAVDYGTMRMLSDGVDGLVEQMRAVVAKAYATLGGSEAGEAKAREIERRLEESLQTTLSAMRSMGEGDDGLAKVGRVMGL